MLEKNSSDRSDIESVERNLTSLTTETVYKSASAVIVKAPPEGKTK